VESSKAEFLKQEYKRKFDYNEMLEEGKIEFGL